METKIQTREIKGDIQRSYRSHVEQKSAEEFLAALDTLLDTPGVKAVRWRQYTPYFNDGDACVFSINEAYVKFSVEPDRTYTFADLDALEDEDDNDDGDYGDGFVGTWELGERWNSETRQYESLGDPTRTNAANALKAFNQQMGAFEDVCLDNFGDHAIITATREGFSVDYYEHD
jgi:hypothetical protein